VYKYMISRIRIYLLQSILENSRKGLAKIAQILAVEYSLMVSNLSSIVGTRSE